MDTTKAAEQKTNHIPLTNVDSSQIKAIGFDAESNTLAVKFNGSQPGDEPPTYHYFHVTPELFDKFGTAPSIGSFFYQHIKGKYDYQRIEPTTGDLKTIARTEANDASTGGDQQEQAAA